MLRAPKSIVVTCSFSFALLPTALRMPATDICNGGHQLLSILTPATGPHLGLTYSPVFEPECRTRCAEL